MNEQDIHQLIWEYADGRPASAELERALRERPELRAELEQARKHARTLRETLGKVNSDDGYVDRLRERILAELPGPTASYWLPVLAAAASVALVLAGLSIYWFVARDDQAQHNTIAVNTPDVPVPAKRRQWTVERFSPGASETQNALVRTEQRLSSGSSLELGQQEYAKLSESETGATWLAYPGARLAAEGELQLQQGSIELQGATNGAEVAVAGMKYRSRSNFSVSVQGAATLVCVFSGTVTQSYADTTETLGEGRHEHGGKQPASQVEAWSAYVKGFEAWRIKDFAQARALFGAAAGASELDKTSRRYAHFYWFATAGCEADKKSAIDIGESYAKAYVGDATVPYVRFFMGKYLLDLGEREKGKGHLAEVAITGSAQLRELAQHLIDQMEGAKMTQAQVLWETFYREWQQQNYAACEKAMLALIRDCPTDASVTGGEARFRIFCAVGNQSRLEDAIALGDAFLLAHPQHTACDYVLYFKASYLSQLGKIEAALETLARLEKDYPESSMRKFALTLREELRAKK